MSAEWPIKPPPSGERLTHAAHAAAAKGRRVQAIIQDLFLPSDARLTEQEHALMMAMLHGLIERIAAELRARLSPTTAAGCAASTTDLIGDLTRAGLLQSEELVCLLLRRADVQRLASFGRGGRSTLQRWTANDNGEVAAAAMAVVTARGRGRDRFGHVALDLSDLPEGLARDLAYAVAAALGLRCGEWADTELSKAVADLLLNRSESRSPEELEEALVTALGSGARRAPGVLVALAEEGDAPILSAILASEARIPPNEAWGALLGGPDRLALLLRLAALDRSEAALLLAAAGPAFGFGDPIRAIEAFEILTPDEVEAARAELALPSSYRLARKSIARHG